MLWRFVKTVCIATAGGIGGWKLRERYEEMLGPVRPTSILARASKLWDSISSLPSSSGSGGGDDGGAAADRRRVRELEEKMARHERDTQKLIRDAIEELKGHPSYQHEFPPLPPQPPAASSSRRP